VCPNGDFEKDVTWADDPGQSLGAEMEQDDRLLREHYGMDDGDYLDRKYTGKVR